jgi:hypothetical protein
MLSSATSRLIFTLPELSPGSGLGVRWAQDRVGQSMHVIPISAATTAADMLQPNECDPVSVAAARVQVVHILHCWLGSSDRSGGGSECDDPASLHKWRLPVIDWRDLSSNLSSSHIDGYSGAEKQCPYLYNAYPWGVDVSQLLPTTELKEYKEWVKVIGVSICVLLLLFACLLVARKWAAKVIGRATALARRSKRQCQRPRGS